MRKAYYVILFMLIVFFCQNTAYAKSEETGKKFVVSHSEIHSVGAAKLSKPFIGSVTATSKATIKLLWIPVENAQKYEVYRSTSKKGPYTRIATTKKTKYTDKTGQQLSTYYYKIRAVGKDAGSNQNIYSPYSIVMKKKVRKIAEKTAYAGDSLMVGLINYGKIKENSSQKIFAKVGISTSAFYKSELMTNLLDYNPDRLYIMLGVNDMPGNPSEKYMDTTIAYYRKILQACMKKNPDIEIFVMGVSPIGKKSTISLDKINYYNRKMEKKVVPLKNVYYYDLALDIAGDDGYLKPEYVAADGLHWTSRTYDVVLKAMKECVKEY